MGYYVRPGRSRSRPFYLIWEAREGAIRRVRTVPISEYASLGLTQSMSLEQAKEIARALNLKSTLEAKRQRSHLRKDAERDLISAYLPLLLSQAFERIHLKRERRQAYLWRGVKAAIIEIGVDPLELGDSPTPLYDYCIRNQYSVDWTRRLITMLNKWLEFSCRKNGVPYRSVPLRDIYEINRVQEKYIDAHGAGNEGETFTPADLNGVRSKLGGLNWNWLYCALWLGIRPSELDRLKTPDVRYWRFEEKHECGYPVLHIFQTKLIYIQRDRRWKHIPIKHPEQAKAIQVIRSGQFKRPLCKTLFKAFGGRHITTYSGRKSFTDLMLSRGEEFLSISRWLGHQKIDITYRRYMAATKVAV